MLQRRKTLILGGCTLLLVLLSLVLIRPAPEPKYKGRPLSFWLTAYAGHTESERQEARQAIMEIGSNAIPCLLRFIRYTPPPWKKLSTTAFQKLKSFPPVRPLIPAALTIDNSDFRAQISVAAFYLVREVADSATPELTRLAFDSAHRQRSDRAISVLILIRPLPKAALSEVLSSAPPDRRFQTLLILAGAGLRNSAIIRDLLPALTKCLRDPDDQIAKRAAFLITLLKFSDPEATLGLLASATKHPSPDVRVEVLNCISTFEAVAAPAVPSLLPLLSDPDRRVRIQATNTFQIIAPDLLRNATSK